MTFNICSVPSVPMRVGSHLCEQRQKWCGFNPAENRSIFRAASLLATSYVIELIVKRLSITLQEVRVCVNHSRCT